MSFFSVVKRDNAAETEPGCSPFEDYFKPFCIKPCMKLAPLSVERSQIRGPSFALGHAKSHTRHIDEMPAALVRFKFLQFHDNTRPGYFGTHSRTSSRIAARQPFAMDTMQIDYSFDSDDEWEDGLQDDENIENLSDEDDGEDEANDDEDSDEDENDWLVPHGYLSEDEGLDDVEDAEPGSVQSREEQHDPLAAKDYKTILREKSLDKRTPRQPLVPKISFLGPSSRPLDPERRALCGARLLIPSASHAGPVDPFDLVFGTANQPWGTTENGDVSNLMEIERNPSLLLPVCYLLSEMPKCRRGGTSHAKKKAPARKTPEIHRDLLLSSIPSSPQRLSGKSQPDPAPPVCDTSIP